MKPNPQKLKSLPYKVFSLISKKPQKAFASMFMEGRAYKRSNLISMYCSWKLRMPVTHLCYVFDLLPIKNNLVKWDQDAVLLIAPFLPMILA